MVKKAKHHHQDPFLERETQKYQTPIPSREYILNVLGAWDGPAKRRALLKHFDIVDPELIEAFRRRLKAMIRDGQILKTHQGFIPITHSEIGQGRITIEREGEGWVKVGENQNVVINGPTLRGIYDGDLVEVQIIQISKSGEARGRIVKLLDAVTPLVIGRLIKTQGHYEILPFDRKFSQNIIVPKEHKSDAQNGDIVQIKILRDEKYSFHAEPVGEVIEILGDFSTPGIEVKMAIRKFGLPHEWPKAVLKECERLPPEVVPPKDERKDITDLPLVTIDGEDAKDFDDAVFCQPRPEGGWQLWVAIADVSFYVRPGSALDKEAHLRGNSTYFPGSVIPMLPEELSNNLCSLKPNVPRLCVVCQMSIDEQGNIARSQFYRGLMHSKARLTYTEVAELIRGNEAVREKYASLVGALEALHDVYNALYAQRRKRGAIDFDTLETRIMFDQAGKIKSIVPQTRNVAHKMIEESMLAANVSAAKFLLRHKQGTLFRVHEQPPQEKLKSLREFLAELGLDLPGKAKPTPAHFSQLIAHIAHREDRHMIETVMLRSLSQAQYSPKNIGHFGLAYGHYLHFTSPIRRYPDLIVHRGIVDILLAKSKQKALANVDLEALGEHCSETERRSDEATRDAALALKCHYMQDKVGEHFRGVVSGVTNFGLFVELKDIYVEGLIHVTALGNEYFHYDATSHRMIGDATRTTYRLGDTLDVTVVRVDVEAKKIDLELQNAPPSEKRQRHKKHTQAKSQKKNKLPKPSKKKFTGAKKRKRK